MSASTSAVASHACVAQVVAELSELFGDRLTTSADASLDDGDDG